MQKDWVEVCIQASVDAGELLGMLNDPAVQGAWEEAGAVHLYWPAAQWNGDRLASVHTVVQRMCAMGMADIAIQVNRLPFQDWNQQWARSVKPLWIGKRIVVRPSWEPVSLQPGQIDIILDPKQAFGTGHHATTRMLLEWLEEDIRGGETVLDAGTGSGLLAMAALRLGAVSAMGIDHDPVAIECAQEYARTNRFGEELSLHCGEIDGGQSFDLVLANLDRQTLLGLADRLTSCTRSRLLVSGVLADQAEEIVAAFATAGLYLGRRREQDGWLAMEFMRAQSCEDVYMKDGRSPYPHVHQISVSDGGVPKRPVFEARVGKTGVERDRQENLKFHGGPDRAVCLYSLELLEQLQDEGHLIDVGLSGENLTIAGLEWNLVKPGSVLSVGPDLQLEVTSYAAPCSKNGRWFRDGDYQRISQEKYPGWSRVYAKVLREGVVRPGDAVTVEREGGQG